MLRNEIEKNNKKKDIKKEIAIKKNGD